eukprot:769669-Rhodomonas_salina.1
MVQGGISQERDQTKLRTTPPTHRMTAKELGWFSWQSRPSPSHWHCHHHSGCVRHGEVNLKSDAQPCSESQ